MDDKFNIEYVEKMYRYMKHNAPVEDFMAKFHVTYNELIGLVELCRMYGKQIDIVPKNNELYFEKKIIRNQSLTKPRLNPDELIYTEICIVSDTHFGNIHQQLHLLNKIYEEAYKRGIKIVLHCGDMVDGMYPTRPEQPRQQFLHGFDEQVGYVVDMYPKVKGIITKYILGSHDETHYKNGQATVNKWVSVSRDDMEYLGQDFALININGVNILMDHPGGGSSQYVSYNLQKRIELFESNYKPKIYAVGHYHKSYYMDYRNVKAFAIPCFCDKTQFQQKKGLSNVIGAYFLGIYSDTKGNIQYIEPVEVLFDKKDIWDEADKDKHKVKQLVIN